MINIPIWLHECAWVSDGLIWIAPWENDSSRIRADVVGFRNSPWLIRAMMRIGGSCRANAEINSAFALKFPSAFDIVLLSFAQTVWQFDETICAYEGRFSHVSVHIFLSLWPQLLYTRNSNYFNKTCTFGSDHAYVLTCWPCRRHQIVFTSVSPSVCRHSFCPHYFSCIHTDIQYRMEAEVRLSA